MKSWIKEQISPAYWLVTASVYQNAVAQLHSSIDGSIPLFEGQPYDDVMTLTPWLVPVSSLVELDSDTLNKGMILTSDVSMSEVVAHLRSLLIAGLEGEEVLFRFYDPQVIMPMLALMNEMDRHALLGHINSWSSVEPSENGDSSVITYSTKPHPDFSVNNAPWWVIKAEHFDEKQDITQLAHHIERRLWATMPQVVNNMSYPKQTLISILQAAEEMNLNVMDAQWRVLATLVVQHNTSVESISQAMSLSWDEEKQLKSMVEDMA